MGAHPWEQGDTLDNKIDSALDRLLVAFGKEILNIVPGRVSTEVDARFSFDKDASIDKALHIIEVWGFLAVDGLQWIIEI